LNLCLELLLFEKNRKVFINDRSLFIEIIKYCERDVLSLSNIINIFANLVYDKFKVNIHKYPTISSLGMGIFLTNYLESDNLIPRIAGQIYEDISKAYHGGHTDVYDLYSDEEVHSYDYSSMYPSEMLDHNMPTGKIDKFEGNPLGLNETFKTLIDKLAYIKCDIYVDKSLNRPTYMTRVLINGEFRSVCATGLFKNQWVFVPELAHYNKLTNGLIKIIPDSIIKGYLFESKNIFKNYINDLYEIKKSVDKSDPWYLIAKLLMNCLYGRMGLRQEIVNYSFLYKYEIEKLSMEKDLIIKDVIDFDYFDKSLLISIKNKDEVNLKSSVPIAAAITAYARMELSDKLLDSSLDIMYIDTDSFKCKQKITELEKYKHLDHNNLGGLKHEETYIESLFLLPKVYGGIIKDSQVELTKIKGFKDKVESDPYQN
jgi:DNA polymerase type B, organellar and viral